MTIERSSIIFTDRDGDCLSATARKGVCDPVISITKYILEREKNSSSEFINSGQTGSVIFDEDEFRKFIPLLWERVLNEPFPAE